MNITPFIHLAKKYVFSNVTQSISSLFLKASLLLSSVLVVGVVREVVKVMFDSHEQAGEPPAATQLGGEDDAWDQVVRSRVG